MSTRGSCGHRAPYRARAIRALCSGLLSFCLWGCSGSVALTMEVPAESAPPCTTSLAVDEFAVVTSGGIHVSTDGHPLQAVGPTLEFALEATPAQVARRARSFAEQFETALRKAVAANARDLGAAPLASPSLHVHGTLAFDERHVSASDARTRVTTTIDAQLVVTDGSGSAVSTTTLNIAGPEPPRSLTSSKYGTSEHVWLVVEQLVRRRVQFELAFATAWSRDVRRGVRAAQRNDWKTAIVLWQRATDDTSATTRRAAHYNLFLAHLVGGRFDEAETALQGAERDAGAAMGSSTTRFGNEPAGSRQISPGDARTQRWILQQQGLAARCRLGSE